MTRFLLPLLLFTASPLAAETLTQQQGPAALEWHFPGPTRSLALADVLTITLTIEGHPSLRVRAPTELANGEPWHMVERSEPKRTPIGSERVRWQMRYRFAPREPGKKIPFAFPEVVLREKDDEDQTIRFDPIDCQVATSIALNDPGQLRGITGIEASTVLVDANFPWRWLLLAAGLLAAVGLAGILRILLKRRTPRSHAQIALYEWQRLTALKLPEKNRSERFITLLTVLVRRYLERQFELPARRLTTPELLSQLAQQSTLTSEDKAFLATFLERSEAVKFASESMSVDECERWSEAVKQFLQRRAEPR